MAGAFDGRHVVVTGGTGALGAAVVEALLSAGAVCHVTWRSERELEHFARRENPQVRPHKLEVTDERQVSALYGGLDPLWASIHVAGGFAMAPVENTSADDFRRMFEQNTLTAFLCCREAIKAIRRTGAGGRIVNVAARPAVTPAGGMVAYSVSKAGVAALTQALAEEVKAEGICINAVLPSVMDTPANRKAMPDADFAKWPKVAEVAAAIAFLASGENALTSGALVPLYGRA